MRHRAVIEMTSNPSIITFLASAAAALPRVLSGRLANRFCRRAAVGTRLLTLWLWKAGLIDPSLARTGFQLAGGFDRLSLRLHQWHRYRIINARIADKPAGPPNHNRDRKAS